MGSIECCLHSIDIFFLDSSTSLGHLRKTLPSNVLDHFNVFIGLCSSYELLAKPFWSRWLVIGQVLFLHFFELRWSQGPQVNKGFIIWLLGKIFLRDTAGSSEWAK